ncbi:hypothetical protein OIO90_003537 [Microbotryomycetes sp. JL221]|nr:hypothetical protein OIO90_003537 [Microbotryomycetes sp. JL221]
MQVKLNTMDHVTSLLGLPVELLSFLISFLDLDSLLTLRLVHPKFDLIISSTTLPMYLTRQSFNRIHSSTIQHLIFYSNRRHDQKRESHCWSLPQQAKWIQQLEHNQHHWTDVRTQTLGGGLQRGQWLTKSMPIIKLWQRTTGHNRLVLARGHELELFEMVATDNNHLIWNERVPVASTTTFTTHHHHQTHNQRIRHQRQNSINQSDITGLSPINERELIVSRVSGQVQRIKIDEPTWDNMNQRWIRGRLVETARYNVGATVPTSLTKANSRNNSISIQAIDTCDNLMVTAFSRRGHLPQRSNPSPSNQSQFASTDPISLNSKILNFSTTSFGEQEPQEEENNKVWSIHLNKNWLALGSTSIKPLTLYMIDETGTIQQNQFTKPWLSSREEIETKTSIYSISTPDESSSTPLLRPNSTLLTGCYDGHVRIFDLRCQSLNEGGGFGKLILDLKDPWSQDANYSVSTFGVQGSGIVSGTSRNSAIRIWDIRMSNKLDKRHLDIKDDIDNNSAFETNNGKTMFLPSKDRSPVYSVVGELSKIYAATDRRLCSVDFDGSRKTRWSSCKQMLRGSRMMAYNGRRRQEQQQLQQQEDEEWDEPVTFYRHERGGVLERAKPL